MRAINWHTERHKPQKFIVNRSCMPQKLANVAFLQHTVVLTLFLVAKHTCGPFGKSVRATCGPQAERQACEPRIYMGYVETFH